MDSNTALIVQPFAMPVLSIQQSLDRRSQLASFRQLVMIADQDFGVIPGTGSKDKPGKPTLLKPGAEKLATFFGLHPIPELIERTEDWTGKDHGGQPFFYYLYRYHLYRDGVEIAAADGSCSSMEGKYRYRNGERVCPNCQMPNIRKSKQGGGWYCWQKTGGCGATFPAGDKSIESQEVGKVLNPDVCDQQNTILKMAQKRALVAAVLVGVNASEFFTQDMEDIAGDYIEGDYRVETGQRQEPPTITQQPPVQAAAKQAHVAPPTNGNGGSNGDKPSSGGIADIMTPEYAKQVDEFVAAVPYYADPKTGKADHGHIRGAAKKNGYPRITTENIGAVWAALKQYAAEQENAPA